jgi:hypothetical protein
LLSIFRKADLLFFTIQRYYQIWNCKNTYQFLRTIALLLNLMFYQILYGQTKKDVEVLLYELRHRDLFVAGRRVYDWSFYGYELTISRIIISGIMHFWVSMDYYFMHYPFLSEHAENGMICNKICKNSLIIHNQNIILNYNPFSYLAPVWIELTVANPNILLSMLQTVSCQQKTGILCCHHPQSKMRCQFLLLSK